MTLQRQLLLARARNLVGFYRRFYRRDDCIAEASRAVELAAQTVKVTSLEYGAVVLELVDDLNAKR
jgi:hypothetical protein